MLESPLLSRATTDRCFDQSGSRSKRGVGIDVQAGDSTWGIAGNDAGIVKWIYDHNPWLNERMERDKRPLNVLGGQNPNYINAGDVIVLPDGFHPASGRG